MTDHAQLIAVAEVLGVDACGDCDPCIGGRPDQCAVSPYPNWLTSLDACFADIVREMNKQGWKITLHQKTEKLWACQFSKTETGKVVPVTILDHAPTAPRAIVKAFLMFNNRWIE